MLRDSKLIMAYMASLLFLSSSVQAEALDNTDPSKVIKTSVDAPDFTIIVSANPTTGYSWQAESLDKKLFKLERKTFVAPQSGRLGEKGQTILKFKVLSFKQALTEKIKLHYRQSWNPKSGVEKVFTVAIEKQKTSVPEPLPTPTPAPTNNKESSVQQPQQLSYQDIPRETPWAEGWE